MNEINPIEPSAWKVEQAVSAWQSTRARLLHDDTDLAHDEARLAELLGDETEDVEAIIARLTHAIQHAKAVADGASVMIDDLRARQDRYKRRQEQFRATLFAVMDALGMKKKELPFATLSIKNGSPSVMIVDETAVPEEYTRTVKELDRFAITVATSRGVIIPGVERTNGIPTIQVRFS